MRYVSLAMALGCAATLTLSRTAVASPDEELDKARRQFRAGDFANALPTLNYLLHPSPRLAQAADLVEAHTLLAACALETGDRLLAEREFEQALSLTPTLVLDNLLFSEAVIAEFERAKANVTARNLRDAEARALAEERERLRKYRESLIVYEVRPYYVNFVPFGAGQFQNNQNTKGMLFAAGQLVTGGTSMGIWLYLVGKYGYGGRVPTDEAVTARRLQQIEIGAGAACLGLMAWGVVDALVHHQPRAKVEGDDSLLPTKLPPARNAWHLGPAITGDGPGLVLGGSF